tara:strand:+ start:1928 stop:3079 length:1152 start_codon:yes stop_codon:yes gene_type:complete
LGAGIGIDVFSILKKENPMAKQKADAIIYAPLEMEYKAVQASFPPKNEVGGDHFAGYITDDGTGHLLLVVTGFEWGNSAARRILSEVFASYTSTTVIAVGIAGAISGDAALGDVFYSKTISDLTQRQKVAKSGRGRSKTTYDPIHYDTCRKISKALDRSRLSVSEKSIYRIWQDACALRNRGKLATHSFKELGKSARDFEVPTANNGQIASTDTVLADAGAVEDVKACGRKMACVDTESAGFADVCRQNSIESFVVIRGVSDQADETKQLTEEKYQNLFREIAVSNAVLFLKYNFDSIVAASESASSTASASALGNLASRIDENEAHIRSELTRRSIAFKAIEKDLRIPVPRVMEQDQASIDPKSKKDAKPVESKRPTKTPLT